MGAAATAWMGELSPRAAVLVASESLPLVVGRFRCDPDDPAWREVNWIGPVPHVVFPRTAVAITPLGRPTVAADANRVVLYDAGQEYRRAPLDPRGDDCLFVALGPEAAEGFQGTAALLDPAGRRFATSSVGLPAAAALSLRLLVADAASPQDDGLRTDELLVDLLSGILGTPAVGTGDSSTAEAVRMVLAGRFREPLTLADVAAAVGMSPYHLHRRFRAETGWTIHAYRDHLRLREGMVRVLEGERDLAALGCDLGYASHSHFTHRFRRAFGLTPSALRTAGARTARS